MPLHTSSLVYYSRFSPLFSYEEKSTKLILLDIFISLCISISQKTWEATNKPKFNEFKKTLKDF